MAEITANHMEIFEAALETLEEGVCVLDGDARVLLWNRAAAGVLGYASAALMARALPADFYEIDEKHPGAAVLSGGAVEVVGEALTERPVLVSLKHHRGHRLPAMLKRVPLRDALGQRSGTLLRFHPIEGIDTLPHGEPDSDAGAEHRLEKSQAAIEDRLDEALHEFQLHGVPFGLLWISVDQGPTLRKTHGADASEAMLGIVERTLLHALRPSEVMGRWGANEFLVLCHERSMEMLIAHANHVAGLSRTADFRWWGDRVSLTVSVGAAQVMEPEKLSCLLKRAQRAMQSSQYQGGNRVTSLTAKETPDTGGQGCSQL